MTPEYVLKKKKERRKKVPQAQALLPDSLTAMEC